MNEILENGVNVALQDKMYDLDMNNKLTDEQRDATADLNIYTADHAMDLFKDMLCSSPNNSGLSESDCIKTLYHLLDFEPDQYVVCDGYDGEVRPLEQSDVDEILSV